MNMRTGLLMLLALVLVAVPLAACRQQNDLATPPEIAYGQDVCDRCKMIINEENMAAAFWTAGGEAFRFDDAGEMLAYINETQPELASVWVHDYVDGTWLRADDATFVLGTGVATPMGFGIVAFADADAGRALAHGVAEAKILDFAALLAGIESGAIVLNPMHANAEHSDDMPAMDHDDTHN